MSILQTRNPTSGICSIGREGTCVFVQHYLVAIKLSRQQMNELEHLHPKILCSLRMSEFDF